MCGIAGIAALAPIDDADSRIRRMCSTIVHRGPDGEGYFTAPGVALGMRRLAVIDVTGGNQPVFNEDGSVLTVFNGEIYNYRELRRELIGAGHTFATQSDTEVIVHGYEQWGTGVLERLNGMFAIALLDRRDNRLLLARDHAGIKPLYYAWDGRRLVWGSEIKALLASGLIERSLDLDALAELLAWEYVPGPATLFRGVRKLPPATWWRLDLTSGAVEQRRYWRPAQESEDDRGTTDAEWIDRVEAALMAAVRRQLVSDVPLGAFLSGGVDSSMIVGAMGSAKTFSIGFEDPSYNELAYSRRAAEHFRVEHVTEVIRDDCLALFWQLLEMLDDPIGDSSVFPTYFLSRLARRNVTVALSGDGGDELFGGYDTHVAAALERRYRRLPEPLRAQVLEPLASQLRPRAAKKGVINKAIRFAEGLRRPATAGHARWRMYLSPDEARAVLTPDAAAAVGRSLDEHVQRLYAEAESRSRLNRELYVDFGSFLVDDILTKVDRMSMAVSLEARVPFLDREVVELAFRVPERLKIRDGQTKWILKKIAERHLPRANVYRPKEGFSAPLKQWIRTSHHALMEELLADGPIARRGLFRVEEVRRLKREHLAGRRNHAHLLWTLMVFSAWERRWLEGDVVPHSEPTSARRGAIT